jgi:1,4-alpha-glucan branching enzyme
MFWFDYYHIDGIRVDAVTSMIYLNYARNDGEYIPNEEGGDIDLRAIDFLKKLNSVILTNYAGCVTIAEESTAYPMITKPPYDGGLGFTFKWNMGFMHDTLKYMSMDHYFRQFNHDKITFSMYYAFSENYILAYSHDEVVHGKKSMLDKMFGDYWQKFASLRALYGFMFAHPGKKLTFMGSEYGQFIEWDYQKQLDWFLLDYPKHKEMQDYTKALNKFYLSQPAFYEVDDNWTGFNWLNVNDNSRSVIAFLRIAQSEKKKYVICAVNFTPVVYYDFVIGIPFEGELREVFNSDDISFGGSEVKNLPVIATDREGFANFEYSAKITLPPLSCVYFEFKPKK